MLLYRQPRGVFLFLLSFHFRRSPRRPSTCLSSTSTVTNGTRLRKAIQEKGEVSSLSLLFFPFLFVWISCLPYNFGKRAAFQVERQRREVARHEEHRERSQVLPEAAHRKPGAARGAAPRPAPPPPPGRDRGPRQTRGGALSITSLALFFLFSSLALFFSLVGSLLAEAGARA